MSLNFDLTKVTDLEAIKSEKEWPITETIILSTMFIGIGHIATDADAITYAERMRAWENAHGPFFYAFDGSERTARPITLADVRKRIGLRCNVSRVTDAQFAKRLAESLIMDAKREIKAEQSK